MLLGSAKSTLDRFPSKSSTHPRHLLHVFPGFAMGGAQMRFAQLAAAHGRRYRHTVVSIDGELTMARHVSDDVALQATVQRFDKRLSLSNLRAIRGMLEDEKPDLLVTYNWGSIAWALANRWLAMAPHLHIEDGFGPEEVRRQLTRRVWMRRVALTGTHTRIVLPSLVLMRIALDQWKLPADSVFYVPNGVDCTRFAPPTGTRKRHDGVVIGTVATLREEKNLQRLIRTFASVTASRPTSALKLVIVGDGPEKAALQAAAQASGMGAHIQFAGATKTPEVPLAEMDIFALSSDTEQMPLSVLEAMACGLPIASVAVGDVSDMVADDNKPYIAPKGDEAKLATVLAALADNPSLRERLGRANRAAVLARFDHRTMVQHYAELFG